MTKTRHPFISILVILILNTLFCTSTNAFSFFSGKDAKLKSKTIVSKKDDKVHVLISIFNTVVLKPNNNTFKDQLVQLYEHLRHIHRHIHNATAKGLHHIASNPWIIILFLLVCIIGLIVYLVIKLSQESKANSRQQIIDNSSNSRSFEKEAAVSGESIDRDSDIIAAAVINAESDHKATTASSVLSDEDNELLLLQQQKDRELQDELQKQSLEQCRMIIEDLMSHAMRQKYIDQEYFSMQEHFAALSHSLATMSLSPSLVSPTATLSPMISRRGSYHPVLPGSFLEKDEYDDNDHNHDNYKTKRLFSSPSATTATAITGVAANGITNTSHALSPLPHSTTSSRPRSRSNSVTIAEDNNQYHPHHHHHNHSTTSSTDTTTTSAPHSHHINSTNTDHTSPSSVLSPMTVTDSPTNLPTNQLHNINNNAKTAPTLLSTQSSSHDDNYFNLPANLKLRYLKGDNDGDQGAWDTGSNNSSSTKEGGTSMNNNSNSNSNKSTISRTAMSDRSNNNNDNNNNSESATTTPLRDTIINNNSSSQSQQSHSLQLAAEAEAALQHQRELQQKLQAERDKLERETILLESSMSEYKRKVDTYQIENVTLSTRCASLEQSLQQATEHHTLAVKELERKLIMSENMKYASEEDLSAMQRLISIAQEEIASANKTIDSLIEQLNTESLFAMESVAKSEERQLQLQQHYKSIIDDLQLQITQSNSTTAAVTNSTKNNNTTTTHDEFHTVKSQLDRQVNINNEMNIELKKYMEKCSELHNKYSHVMSVHEAVREENHLAKKRLTIAEEEIQLLKTLSSPVSARNGSNGNSNSNYGSSKNHNRKSPTTTLLQHASSSESISMVEKLLKELKHLEAISGNNNNKNNNTATQPQITNNFNNSSHTHTPLSIDTTTGVDTNAIRSQHQQQLSSSPRSASNNTIITPRSSSHNTNKNNTTTAVNSNNTTKATTTGSPRSTATTISSRDTGVTSDKNSGSSNNKKIVSPSSSLSSPSSSSSSATAVITPNHQKNTKRSNSSSSTNNNNPAKTPPNDNNKIYIITNSNNSISSNTKSNSKPQQQTPPPLPPSRLSNMLRMAHSSASNEGWGKNAARDSNGTNTSTNKQSSSSNHSLSSSVSVSSSGMSGSGSAAGGKSNNNNSSCSSIGSLSPTRSSTNSMFNRLLQRPQPPY